MLRRLQVIDHKNADATCVAAADMTRGMVVTKDVATNKVALASASVDVYFVDKEPDYTGIYAMGGEFSDYTSDFESIKQDDFVVVEKPMPGEIYATDAITATGLAAGDALKVTAGKFAKAAASDVTMFKYGGTYSDAGHTLHIVHVTEAFTVPTAPSGGDQ